MTSSESWTFMLLGEALFQMQLVNTSDSNLKPKVTVMICSIQTRNRNISLMLKGYLNFRLSQINITVWTLHMQHYAHQTKWVAE